MSKNNRLKKLILLILTSSILFSCGSKAKKSTETQRIISMAPNITEILYSLGMQDQLVGVSDYCKYPIGATEKENIGGLFNPNLEKIISLNADLILATESYQSLVEKLGEDRFKIVLLPEKTIEDIFITIDSIGVLTNTQKRADSLVTLIKDSLDYYKPISLEKKPTTILVLGRDAGTTRNIGISGPGAFINELWEWIGGINAFPDMAASFSIINREDLLVKNPQLIIEFKSNKNWSLAQDKFNRTEWRDLQISAVKNNHIFVIPGNNFLIPGPRMYLLAKEYNRIFSKFNATDLK